MNSSFNLVIAALVLAITLKLITNLIGRRRNKVLSYYFAVTSGFVLIMRSTEQLQKISETNLQNLAQLDWLSLSYWLVFGLFVYLVLQILSQK